MSKRAPQFERHERDLYDTPAAAVWPLVSVLGDVRHFIEPCCGRGVLVEHLENLGLTCLLASDIYPLVPYGAAIDATSFDFGMDTVFITNPPWNRKILHPLIVNLSNQSPTWLLFDSDWLYTHQAKPFRDRLVFVQAVGRVKWIAGSDSTGKDNAAWYLFDKPDPNRKTIFGMMP